MAKKPERHGILITAVDNAHDLQDGAVWLFWAKHALPNGQQFKQALKNAFKEWTETDEGKEFVEQNGTNWGDAAAIPCKFLNKYGIGCYIQVVEGSDRSGVFEEKLVPVVFHERMLVDHNESLV